MRLAKALERCEGDSRLQLEIRNLLLANEKNGSFLEEPAILAMHLDQEVPIESSIEPGTVLSERFKVGRLVNTGGMGSVYEAWDAELDELVALKTIRPELSSQELVIERFKEEVKQARCIAHPNICRVYDLFCHNSDSGTRVWFLTMQFLEGKTLLERVNESGPIPRRSALGLIEQLISGLAAAHELGVVHRDLKSSNIMLVPIAGKADRAVITDFGLAMRTSVEEADASRNRSQGTPAYVPPEQWYEGKVSPAGDQYSLGVVMCEMLTGERPIPAQRRSVGGELSAQLPKSRNLDTRTQKAICRCLEVDPLDRFASVTNIVKALGIGRRRVLQRSLIGAGIVLAVLTSLVIAASERRRPSIRNLNRLTPAGEYSVGPGFSKDGSLVVYASDRERSVGSDIWVRRLADGLPVGSPMRVTTDGEGNDDPSLSPDGQSVAFTSTRDHGGIFLADVARGGERLLVRDGRRPQFSPDGKFILYWTGDNNQFAVPSGRIYILDVAKGQSTQLASGFPDAREPIWNSDGRHILFRGCPFSAVPLPACWDWWVTTADGAAPVRTGARAKLEARGLAPIGDIGGWYGQNVLFNAALGQEVHLWALAVSPENLQASGDPEELTPGDARESVFSSVMDGKDLLAITNLFVDIHIWRIDHISSPDRAKPYRVTEDADIDLDPYVSANGRWLTFARGRAIDRSILIMDMKTGDEKKLPIASPDKFSPVVDDSGTTVAYESWEKKSPSIFIFSMAGDHSVRICTECRTPLGWYNQGAGLLLTDPAMSRIDLYRVTKGQRQTILSKPGAYVSQATWSPANQMLLFAVSSDLPKGQVFASRFPAGADLPDSHWIAVTSPAEFARDPRWSSDGRTVFYESNRDNYWCLWGQHFDPKAGRPLGKPFVVQHYHNLKFLLSGLNAHSFNISVVGDAIYLNVAEMNSSIWTGKLDWKPRFNPISSFF